MRRWERGPISRIWARGYPAGMNMIPLTAEAKALASLRDPTRCRRRPPTKLARRNRPVRER